MECIAARAVPGKTVPCEGAGMAVARRPRMNTARRLLFVASFVASAATASAQPPPPPEPPPLWDVQLGAAFVGTGGNSETATLGADFGAHRRWPLWKIEATATAVRTTDRGIETAERYLAAFRADRTLTPRIALSGGERAERDRLAGIAFRSITDGGLKYALVRRPNWTLDGLTSLALNHEEPVDGPSLNHPIGVLQALNKYLFSPAADTTQRFTIYPDFEDSDAYRAEAEVTAQAAMNSRLALKLGYLWRYSNLPAFGFEKSDNTATASIVVRWKAATAAPAP
jgi:putative salt-induced outer membrane protein YdiY